MEQSGERWCKHRKNGGVDDNILDEYSILQIDQFSFENLKSENLFNPMLLCGLQKYPVHPSSLGSLDYFREYRPEKRGKWNWCAFDCNETEDYVQKWAYVSSRPKAYDDMLGVHNLEHLE